ncbi:MAG: DUF927 domain-containing protein [Candidatus Contendobacter sp.]|nr:DUF927 domain-containing protein [Candidatus Contendobacter sp.]
MTQQWVCSPLYIAAVSFDGQENNFGRRLRFRNTLGRWWEWAMPMELPRGVGDDLCGELLAMGVQIDPNAHRLLGQYLQAKPPKRRVRCALQVGWCGDVFVLPDEVIGPEAADVIFQSGERGHDEHIWRHAGLVSLPGAGLWATGGDPVQRCDLRLLALLPAGLSQPAGRTS